MATQKAISIPEPQVDLKSLWTTAKALKEAVEILQGIRGNRAAALESDVADRINHIQDQIDALP